MSVSAVNTLAVPLELDANLVSGRTYVFQFADENFFTSGTAKLQQDLVASAPDFLGSLQVQPISLGLTQAFLNVQFTYTGDGTDVVTDVANAMSAAFLAGSNDSFTFVAAFPNSATEAPTTPASQQPPTVGTVASSAVAVVTDTANQVAAGAGTVTNTATSAALKAAAPWLIAAVLIVVVVLPVVAKSGLVPKVRVA